MYTFGELLRLLRLQPMPVVSSADTPPPPVLTRFPCVPRDGHQQSVRVRLDYAEDSATGDVRIVQK